MTVKEWLMNVRCTEARLHALEEQKKRVKALAYKAGVGSYEALRISGSEQRSRVEEAICNADELECRILAEINKSMDMMRDARLVIDEVSNYHHRTLLDMRYLSGWGWDKVCEELNMDKDYANRLHAKALASASDTALAMPEMVAKYNFEPWKGNKATEPKR